VNRTRSRVVMGDVGEVGEAERECGLAGAGQAKDDDLAHHQVLTRRGCRAAAPSSG
jgi:hypothetical protein